MGIRLRKFTGISSVVLHDWTNYRQCECGQPGCWSFNPHDEKEDDDGTATLPTGRD